MKEMPALSDGYDWLQIAIAVDTRRPLPASEVASTLSEAYEHAVAALPQGGLR